MQGDSILVQRAGAQKCRLFQEASFFINQGYCVGCPLPAGAGWLAFVPAALAGRMVVYNGRQSRQARIAHPRGMPDLKPPRGVAEAGFPWPRVES